MIDDIDDRPRSMRDPGVRERRKAMLRQPHILPLTEFAAALRRQYSLDVPEFDPLDGGVEAQLLFLFEKPGPMTSERGGSGFISRNNDDPTAEATYEFMRLANIPRRLTVTWNVIPWWNGTRKVTAQELNEGIASVTELIALLPELRAVVLVGTKARKAEPYFKTYGQKDRDLEVLVSPHPSPLVRATFPARWNAIPRDWGRALKFVVENDRRKRDELRSSPGN